MSSEIVPGRLFRLTPHLLDGLGREEPFDLRITACHYSGANPNILRKSGGEGSDDLANYFACEFEAFSSQQAYYTPVPSKPLALGPELASVVEEPDQHGCIRVRFQWDRPESNSNASEKGSIAMRYHVPWSGDNWGMIYPPRQGQEVLVNFIDQDINQPIACFMGYTMLHPYDCQETAYMSGWKSQSTPDASNEQSYNELHFNDKLGHEQVYLRAQQAFQEDIGNRQTIHVSGRYQSYTGTAAEAEKPLAWREKVGFNRLRADATETEAITQQVRVDGHKNLCISDNLKQVIGSNYKQANRGCSENFQKNSNELIHLNVVEIVKQNYESLISSKAVELIEAELGQRFYQNVAEYFEGNLSSIVKGSSFLKTGKDSIYEIKGNVHLKMANWKVEANENVVISSKKKIGLKSEGSSVAVEASAVAIFAEQYDFNNGGSSAKAEDVDLTEPEPPAYSNLIIEEINAEE